MYAPKVKNILDEQVKGYFDGREVHQAGMYAMLHALYWDAAGKYSKRMKSIFRKNQKASGQMGFIGEFADAFKNFFELYLRNIAQLITETTIKQIKEFIAEKIKAGYDLRDVAKQMEELFEVNKVRALRIARTETTASANAAGYFSALNQDYYMTKEWLAADDNRTRKTHGHAGVNGTKINLEDVFTVGNYELRYPGDKGGDGLRPVGPEEVVNCRCTLAYRARRDEAGRIMMKEK